MPKFLTGFAFILTSLIVVSGALVGLTLFSPALTSRANLLAAASTVANPTTAIGAAASPDPTVLPSSNATPGASATPRIDTSKDPQPSLPLRAAFYNAGYPQAWTLKGISPSTIFNPSLGNYDSTDPNIISKHIAAMQYGNIAAALVSWLGPNTPSDQAFSEILDATTDSTFRWAVFAESVQGISTIDQLSSELTYLHDHYAADPSYLRIDGRFVVFVSSESSANCDTVDRWKQANTVNAYIVLKVFSGYRNCAGQPDGWHQYAPSVSDDSQKGFSYTISPGYSPAGDKEKLPRDLARWYTSIHNMIASHAPFQLITSFNDWGKGTAVESAKEWESPSGFGAYLDALHTNGDGNPPTGILQDSPPRPTVTAKAAPTPKPAGAPAIASVPQSFAASKRDVVLGAAGDIACDPTSAQFNSGKPSACREQATSDILLSLQQKGQLDAVAALGDNTYENGALDKFKNSYDPTWGRLKDITHPAVGNHEYLTHAATGYYDYYGSAAGDPKKGYYSYNLGTWHIVVINSNCSQVGGCGKDSPQEHWLTQDLLQSAGHCTLAYWHHPRFSSGEHGNFDSMQTIWQDLLDYGTSIVLSGHSHDYERFAPQDATGHADPNGIREFVVGTGGKNHTGLYTLQPNSQVFNDNTYGILKLTLHPSSYDWQFLPEAGKTFSDSGSGTCAPRHP